jgi:hypothetical protein
MRLAWVRRELTGHLPGAGARVADPGRHEAAYPLLPAEASRIVLRVVER